ncbi:hypothetical protein BC828DRAFT_47401, partial [Blastocladiella britannica]
MIDHVARQILELAAGAARSPEDALHVLNVLPQHDDPTMCAAVLSRGFPKFSPALAVKHRHTHLLPRYPQYILFHTLQETLAATGERGDLPALKALWAVAGPATVGRVVWLAMDTFGLTYFLLSNGHIEAFEWLLGAAEAANIRLPNSSAMESSAEDQPDVLCWLIEHDLISIRESWRAFSSATNGNVTHLENWIASQPDRASAIASYTFKYECQEFLQKAQVKALDWWWTHLANSSELPEQTEFHTIIGKVLCRGDISALDWWWDRFLECRTPVLQFISEMALLESHWDMSIESAKWLWHHSHSSGSHWDSLLEHAFPFASDWHDLILP